VKNLVLSFAIFESFSQRDSFRAFSRRRVLDALSQHRRRRQSSWPPAAGALSEREDFFVAGLMHDIGKIPLNHLFPEAYREAAAISRDSGRGMRFGEERGSGRSLPGRPSDRREMAASPTLAAALSGHHAVDDGGQTSSTWRMW